MHGLWTSNIPSRFRDELPEADVAVMEAKGGFGGMGYPAASRFDEMTHFGSSYGTPGWQRAQRAKNRRGGGGFGGGSTFDEDPETYSADEWDAGDATASPLAGKREGGD